MDSTFSGRQKDSSGREDDSAEESQDFNFLDISKYNDEEDERKFEPPAEDNYLPDLSRLILSLDDGDSDLESCTQPPSLFARPEHVPSYKKISELKLQLEEEQLHNYVENFDKEVEDDVLLIGNISLEEVQEEEKRLRDEHILYQNQEADLAKQSREHILIQEENAKRRLAKTLKERRRLLAKKEELAQQRERLLMDKLHKAFRRAENQLTGVLTRRKAEVKTMYGDLTMADGEYGGSKGRRWKIDWNRTPQPIQIKLNCLRGVKDKLPGGRYILMVSLYNRLGGSVMRWSNLKGQQWAGATLPVTHDGNFYNAELKVDQSVFTVLPSKANVRPGMCLVYELFLLRGKIVPTDRVVGWGCFPVCDGQFNIIEGQYKLPFLRGEMDLRIDKYEKIEELIASDMDHWLCNLYFEVIKLPRYMAGQKEFEVELQFSSGLLSYPDRVHSGEKNKDGEQPITGSHLLMTQDSSIINVKKEDLSGTGSPEPSFKNEQLLDSEKKTEVNGIFRSMTVFGSRNLTKDRISATSADDSDLTDFEDNDTFALKTAGAEFIPVKGEMGLFYKRHVNNPADVYARKMFTMLPKTPLLTKRRRHRKLTHLEELEQYKASVQPPFSEKGHLENHSWKRASYIGRQLLSELGLSQWRSREFWGMLLMFAIVFFIRIYVHYIGQWIFLNGISIPINKFDFLPYTVNLNYQSTLLHTREEITTVVIGPFGNIIVFTMLVISSWISQKVFSVFPDVASKFVIAYGLQAFLDPVLIAAVDACLFRHQNLGGTQPIADFAKMYWHFYNSEGSGLAGIFITVFLYVFIWFVACSILYMYFLRLHNNGRMLDIYWRLHASEEHIFLPHDLEMSNQELSYICKKANQWRGEEGERRKVAVYDYIWETNSCESKCEGKEITTHVSIHTLHLDGLREMYRHFLRLPDGSIIEVFGEMAVRGMDKDIKNALAQGVQQVGKLDTDQAFNKNQYTQMKQTDTNTSSSLSLMKKMN